MASRNPAFVAPKAAPSSNAEPPRPISLWPIAIIEDRYGGTYSGGKWLAIAEASERHDGQERVAYALSDGPHGGDCEAMEFWLEPPSWIAVGNSPDEALAALRVVAAHERVS